MREGVTEAQVEALQEIRKGGTLDQGEIWDDRQLALLRLLDQVINYSEPSDETFCEARKWFCKREIVEIITAQGFYYMWSRFATTLRVSVDKGKEGDYDKAKTWAFRAE
ncbi:hypothetical protein BJY01DRAFT_252859 [Aspergillus pseudoustus]|uniref:Uncharacterized protein n=1 Tax=Aspergillus pseudoustus TaxID=1810923 RepID=A0ABR4J5G1_9EURO